MAGSPSNVPAFDPGRLLEVLNRHGVDFVVVGGIAGMAHGSAYPSFDLDVAYAREPENVRRLVAALRELGVTLRGAPTDLPFQLEERTIHNGANFTFNTAHGPLDIFAAISGISSYDELRAAASLVTLERQEVRLASIDHLIAMKRAANRPKDQLMVEEYVVIAQEQARGERSR